MAFCYQNNINSFLCRKVRSFVVDLCHKYCTLAPCWLLICGHTLYTVSPLKVTKKKSEEKEGKNGAIQAVISGNQSPFYLGLKTNDNAEYA